MKIKLSSIDVLQISKALKSGWLDLDKIDTFKSLVEGYNPPELIDDKKLAYYKDCLFKGWGYEPTPINEFNEIVNNLDSDQLSKWEDCIKDGRLYSIFVERAFWGLIAIKALGGTFEEVKPDFSFIEDGIKKQAQTKEL